MALATLSVDLIAKVAGFEQELKRVADSTTRQANAMAGAIGVVRASVAGLAGAISAGAIVAFVRATNDGVDALNDLKDATGASIENISALEDVADRTGTSMETVGAALIKFNDALKDAKPDSAAAAALKAIGLSAADLKRLDPAEALRVTAVALSKYADDGDKARLVQELFGRSVREVAPLLNDLAEKSALVGKVTAEQAAEAEKFNKQLFEMQTNSKAAARALVSDLVEGINKAAKAWKESGLVAGIQTLLTGDDEHKNNKRLVALTDQLLNAERALVNLRSQLGPDSPEAKAQEKRIAALKEELKTVQAYRQVLDGAKPQTGGEGKASVGSGWMPDPAAKAAHEKLMRELAALKKQDIDGWVKYADAVLEEGEAMDAELRRQAEERNDYEEKMRQKDLAGWVAYAQARVDEDFDMARQIADQQIDALRNTNDIGRDLGLTFSSAAEDAMVNWRDLGEVVKGVGKDIARIIYRKSITEPLGGAVSDATKNVNWKELFSFADGGIMTANGPLPLRAYAGGGIASSPQIALYGEGSMNEAFVPLPDGRRIPVAMQGGSGVSISQTFHIDARADQASIMAAIRQGGEAIKAEILRSRRAGGAFA